MKVRIRANLRDVDYWHVECWRWYWPFWVERVELYNRERAIMVAKELKTPTIEEIK